MPVKMQPSFAAGEVSPEIYGRPDISKFAIGLEKMENFYVIPQGAARFREGFQYVSTLPGTYRRMIPFTFSVVQTYMLVFTDLNMEVVKDGAVVASIVSPFAGADLAELRFTQKYDTLFLIHNDYQTRTLTRTSDIAWTFSLLDTANTTFAPAIAQLSWVGSGSQTRTVQYRISAFKDPDVTDDNDAVQETLPSAVETINVPSPWPDGGHVTVGWNPLSNPFGFPNAAWVKSLTGTNEYFAGTPTFTYVTGGGPFWTLSASGTNEYYYTTSQISNPSNIGLDRVLIPQGTVGSLAENEWDYADNDGIGSDALYIRLAGGGDPDAAAVELISVWGGQGYLSDDPYEAYYEGSVPLIEGTKGTLAAGEYVFDLGTADSIDNPGAYYFYVRMLDAATADPASKPDGYLNYRPADELGYTVYKNYAGAWGFVGFTDNAWFIDDFITPDTSYSFKTGANPFDAAGDYPLAGGIFQQRLWLARTDNLPSAVFGSQIDLYSSFDKSDPILDTDSITASLATGKVREIKHILPVEAMLVFTGDSEWVLTSGSSNSAAITPNLRDFKYQSGYGIGTVEPLVADNNVMFVERTGKSVRNLSFQISFDKYTGNDMTVLASHLLKDFPIVSWAYASRPYSIIWAVRSDGVLLSFTYKAEQDVWAWARHTTDGLFKDVGVITTDDRDDLYVAVERVVDGTTYEFLEQLALNQPPSDVDDSIYFDSSLSYSGAATSTVSGLDHLNGAEVYCLADGDVVGPYTVSGGSITLDRSASVITAGLPYEGLLKTLKMETQDMQLQGKRQKVLNVSVRMEGARGLEYGTKESKTWPIKIRTDEGYDEGTRLFTGDKVLSVDDGWSLGSQVVIKKLMGTPATIQNIGPNIAAGGQVSTSV